MCSGYYNYEEGYTPEFPGTADFTGRIVHPQNWPEDLDYAGKRVVVIGSGATAVTLVPEMAKTAAHVTMLQRSPTYVVSRPAEDALANKLRRSLPAKLAYDLTRWKNVLFGMYFFQLCRRKPDRAKQLILDGVKMALGPEYDVGEAFHAALQSVGPAPVPGARRRPVQVDPRQARVGRHRPDRHLHRARHQAEVRQRARGRHHRHRHGAEPAGARRLEVERRRRAVDLARTLNYKGMMYSDVPNLASAFGYTNASWTLKCDLTCEYVCRLINYMDRHGYRQCMPHNLDPSITELPSLDFSSGYVQRSIAKMPKQGSKRPWRLYQNYALDIVTLRYGKVDDGVMRYS